MPNFKIKIAFIFFSLLYLFSSTVIPTFAAISYTYDADGNMASDGSKCYTYNNENQLSQVKDCGSGQVIATYIYDYQGNRLIKKNYVNGTLSNTVYSPEDEYETRKIASNSALQNTTYYFVNNQQIAKKNPDGSKTYVQNDDLGSSSILTDASGAVVESTTYDPWGEVKTGGTKDKFQYTGQEKDSETGLNYYNSRYYNPYIRRFVQPDTLLPDIYNPQTLNRYSYVNNNPLRYTDPSGHFAGVLAVLAGLIAPEVVIPAAIAAVITTMFAIPATRNAIVHTVAQAGNAIVHAVTNTISNATKVSSTAISTNRPNTNNSTPTQNNTPKMPNLDPIKKIVPAIPAIANTVLQQIQKNGGDPLDGYSSGIYENRTEPLLPEGGAYLEHDIQPFVEGVWRGTQRLVIDTITGKAWYTPDHYKSWIPFD